MGHIPEDENIDEFMNASAEEWSKPEEAPEVPEVKAESADRWGSEPLEPTKIKPKPEKEKVKEKVVDNFKEKKSGAKWWIIAIIALVVFCICICAAIFGLSYFGITNFDWPLLESISY